MNMREQRSNGEELRKEQEDTRKGVEAERIAKREKKKR